MAQRQRPGVIGSKDDLTEVVSSIVDETRNTLKVGKLLNDSNERLTDIWQCMPSVSGM